jgi:phosphomevalonate kinase
VSVHDASGKLVLLGEYAVVDGGAALVLAVAQGVRCTVSPAAVLEIETPAGDDRFARAALAAIGAPHARYRFSDREPLTTPGKPGFGGSAAATVAALRAGGFRGTRAELTALGMQVHQGVQGSGSGVDVAAAAHGGGLRFQRGQCEPLQLPTPVVVYTGESASTGPRVERYRSWADRAQFVERSDTLVDQFLTDPMGVTREAWRLLTEMADAAGIPYRTPAIDQLVAMAEAAGGAAKPSGAGGGDSVVALVPDAESFASSVRGAGFHVLDIRPDPPWADSVPHAH